MRRAELLFISSLAGVASSVADPPQVAEGSKAYAEGRYAEAEKLFAAATQDHVSEFNLAAVYRAQGRYAEAEIFYRRSIDHDPSRPAPLDGLALTCQAEGKLAEAEKFAARALELEASSRTLNVLAFILTERGDQKRAESLARRALSMAAPISLERAQVLDTLAKVNRNRKKYEAAESLYREPAGLFETVTGPESVSTASAWNNLAQILKARGRLAEAEGFYGRASAVLSKVYGPSDPRVVAVERNREIVRNVLLVDVRR